MKQARKHHHACLGLRDLATAPCQRLCAGPRCIAPLGGLQGRTISILRRADPGSSPLGALGHFFDLPDRNRVALASPCLSSHHRASRERRPCASLGNITSGKEGPGDELPISTWRASPTGRPRVASCLALSRSLSARGLSGKSESSAFPTPACGEGAEGVG